MFCARSRVSPHRVRWAQVLVATGLARSTEVRHRSLGRPTRHSLLVPFIQVFGSACVESPCNLTDRSPSPLRSHHLFPCLSLTFAVTVPTIHPDGPVYPYFETLPPILVESLFLLPFFFATSCLGHLTYCVSCLSASLHKP